MMFSSLASRFPDPLPPDFFEFDNAGGCFVAFSAYELLRVHERDPHYSGLTPIQIVTFFDADETSIASIYCFGVNDIVVKSRYTKPKREDLVTYMMEFYPDIGEYLLWHQ